MDDITLKYNDIVKEIEAGHGEVWIQQDQGSNMCLACSEGWIDIDQKDAETAIYTLHLKKHKYKQGWDDVLKTTKIKWTLE